ncbi:MAG: hypothetical protein WA721_12590 [Candidatus Binataceae bacterium]
MNRAIFQVPSLETSLIARISDIVLDIRSLSSRLAARLDEFGMLWLRRSDHRQENRFDKTCSAYSLPVFGLCVRNSPARHRRLSRR